MYRQNSTIKTRAVRMKGLAVLILSNPKGLSQSRGEARSSYGHFNYFLVSQAYNSPMALLNGHVVLVMVLQSMPLF